MNTDWNVFVGVCVFVELAIHAPILNGNRILNAV